MKKFKAKDMKQIVLALVLMLILTPLTVHGQGEVLGVKGYL